MADVKDLQRAYSEGEGEEMGETPTPQPMANQSPWAQRRAGSFTKTKSFDNELKVPTMLEAQALMSSAKTRSTSVEGINQTGRITPEPTEEERKRRSRSPFRFFTSGKKEESSPATKTKPKTGGRAAETGMDGLVPPTISIHNASFRLGSPFQQIVPPSVPERNKNGGMR